MEYSDIPLGVKFAIIHRAFRREVDAMLREKGLTAAQFGVLNALDRLEHEGAAEINQRDVEAMCRSTHPTMTEMLKKLEKKGFIETRVSETDRRRKIVCRTERAKELGRETVQVDEQTFAKFSAGLDGAQTAQLETMLDALLRNVCGSEKEDEA